MTILRLYVSGMNLHATTDNSVLRTSYVEVTLIGDTNFDHLAKLLLCFSTGEILLSPWHS